MPGSTPATSQLDWLISTTAITVLSWSRATRDLLKSFGWGIGALHRLATATMVPSPRRLPHSISRSHPLARRQTHGPDRMNGAERAADLMGGEDLGDIPACLGRRPGAGESTLNPTPTQGR